MDSKTAPSNAPIKRHYARSSSFQMALLFTVLCGISVVILGYFGYFFARGHFIHGTETVIDTEINYISKYQLKPDVQNNERLYLSYTSEDELYKTFPQEVTLLKEGIFVFNYPENNRLYAAKIHTFPDTSKILIGVDITETQKKFTFMKRLCIASIVFIVIVVLVSYLISMFVVKGTNDIAYTAHKIMSTGDLSRRVDVGSQWDDLGNMARVFNSMLDRIQELMTDVRHISDNIAHDLRTPLTRMRNNIEGLNNKNDKKEYSDLLNEADHILETFNAMLRISRIEVEQKRSNFDTLNLKTILGDALSFYAPLAEEKHIIINSNMNDADCMGDKDLLFQSYANLLDNAIKFTPENGQINITLSNQDGRAIVEIADSGNGVHEYETKKIFQRFYRGDKSRSSIGTGLGLSLVAAVIELHQGEIVAVNEDDGFRIITKI